MIQNQKFRDESIKVSQVNNLESLDKAMEYAKSNNFTKVIVYKDNGFELKEVK